MPRRHRQLRVRDPDVFLLLPATPLAHRHARILRTIPVDHTIFCFRYPDLHHGLIGLCVKVMWVESSIAPPSLIDIERLIDGVFGLAGSGLTNKLKENFIWDQCTVWKATLLDQIGLNESKARWLHAAQGALALAMLAVGLLLFFTMLRIVGAPRLLSV